MPRQSAALKANKKRKTASDVFVKIDEAFESFVAYQQAADKSFLEAEAERERREEERAEKRRKEDQEFLLKLAQVLHKWNQVGTCVSFSSVLTFCASC